MDLASLPVLHAAFFVLGAATVPFSAASTSILVLFAGEGLAWGWWLTACCSRPWPSGVSSARSPGDASPGGSARARPTMRAGLLIEALTSAIIALWQDAYVVGMMLALFGFHALVWNVVTISLRQELVPDGLLGRVNSSYRLLGMGGAAAGALLGGLFAKGFGLTAPFWFAAASVAVMTAVAWRTIVNGAVMAARQNADTSA